MAREFFPGADKRLQQIVFSAPIPGIIYLHMEAFWSLTSLTSGPQLDIPDEPDNDNPRPEQYRFKITGLPGLDDFYVNPDKVALRGPKVKPLPTPPTILNPVTAQMMAYYAAWTPDNAPPFFKRITKNLGDPGEFWVWDTASFQLVYDHIITHRSSPIMTRDAALAMFQGLAGHAVGYEHMSADKMGVIIQQAFDIYGNEFDPPTPPDDYSRVDAGWTGHFEPSAGGSGYGYGEQVAANLIINVQTLVTSMSAAQQKAKAFKFRIVPDTDKQVNLRVDMYRIKKPKPTQQVPKPLLRSDYPVDDTKLYRPTWTGPDIDWYDEVTDEGAKLQYELMELFQGGFEGYIEVTVQPKPFKISYTVENTSTIEVG